jgi:hypothetical protein
VSVLVEYLFWHQFRCACAIAATFCAESTAVLHPNLQHFIYISLSLCCLLSALSYFLSALFSSLPLLCTRIGSTSPRRCRCSCRSTLPVTRSSAPTSAVSSRTPSPSCSCAGTRYSHTAAGSRQETKCTKQQPIIEIISFSRERTEKRFFPLCASIQSFGSLDLFIVLVYLNSSWCCHFFL